MGNYKVTKPKPSFAPDSKGVILMFPPWVVLHIPHNSRVIPASLRDQFVLDNQGLCHELDLMTDHLTYDLFVDPNTNNKIVCSNVSRLIIDVERFEDDCLEPMAAIGMGAIYTSTSSLKPLRRAITADERTYLMAEYYHPHHRALESAVNESLENHGQCLIIDCHSFPNTALPYENVDKSILRPDICIGTDSFHTSDALRKAFTDAFRITALNVATNNPFAGSMVPASRYRKDERVQSIMIEVNRDLYLDPITFNRNATFDATSILLRAACMRAIIDSYREKY